VKNPLMHWLLRLERNRIVDGAIRESMAYYDVKRLDPETHAHARAQLRRLYDQVDAIDDYAELVEYGGKLAEKVGALENNLAGRMIPARVITRAAYGITSMMWRANNHKHFKDAARKTVYPPSIAVVAVALLLGSVACKRDDVRQMNPMDLPPAHADDPPRQPYYDWGCHHALRELAAICTKECWAYDYDGPGPKATTCGRNILYKDDSTGSVKQGYWKPCDNCRWGCMRFNEFVNNSILPRDEGEPPNCPYQTHSACVPEGPDPAVECKR
jgi:hypothetical protein